MLSNFKVDNIRGMTAALLLLYVAAIIGVFGIAFAFRGSVQI